MDELYMAMYFGYPIADVPGVSSRPEEYEDDLRDYRGAVRRAVIANEMAIM
jgi:hypothetical protein